MVSAGGRSTNSWSNDRFVDGFLELQEDASIHQDSRLICGSSDFEMKEEGNLSVDTSQLAISLHVKRRTVASRIAYLFRRLSDMRVESDKQFDGVGEVRRLSPPYRFTRLEESIPTSKGREETYRIS